MDIADATYSEHINSKSFAIKKFLSKLLFLSTALTLILIAGLRPVGLDRDSGTYATYYIQPVTEINLLDKEPAFWAIKWINDTIFNGNVHTFFLIFALLGVSIKFLAIKKLSRIPWLSVVAYVSMYFILHEMTQIRAGVAAGIFLLSIPDIYNRNLKGYIFKTVLSTSFHYSAIIMAPLYFLNPKKISPIYLLLPIICLFFYYTGFSKNILILSLDFLPKFLAYKIQQHLLLMDLGMFVQINPLRILNYLFLSFLLIFFIVLNTKSKLSSAEVIYIKILSISISVFFLFNFFPVLAGRISEFLNINLIILLPSLLVYLKQKRFGLAFISFYFFALFIYNLIFLLNWEVIQGG